jgi:alpha-glucosidase
MKNRLHLVLTVGVVAVTAACGGSNDPAPGVDAADDVNNGDAATDGSSDATDAADDATGDSEDSSDDSETSDDSDVESDVVEPPPCDGLAYDELPDGTFRCFSEACELEASDGTVSETTIQGWTIAIDSGTGAFSVVPPHGGDPVLETDGPCENPDAPALRVGIGEPSVMNDVGSFRIGLEAATMRWYGPLGGAPTIEADDERISITHRTLDNGTFTISFSALADRDLIVATQWSGSALEDGAELAGELSWKCNEDTAYFGLGTQATGMDLRGGTFPLWTQEQGIGKPARPAYPLENYPEAAYAPMGVWHSTDGLSALLASDVYHELSLCDERRSAEQVSLRSFPGLPAFVLLAGETPRDRIAVLTDYVGRLPAEPIPWTFAPWNDAVGGPTRLLEVAANLRSNGIPSSAIWSEDWIGGEQGPAGFRLSYAWEWDEELYPDLPELIEQLHGDGFAFLAYFNTFVPQPTRMFAEGEEGGFLVTRADGRTYTVADPAFRDAGLVDLTNPAARDWFAGYMTRAAELGIDGWMADFTEWMPVDAVLHSGLPGWNYHNRWPLDYQRLTNDVLTAVHAGEESPQDRNFVFFVRSGWASVSGGTAGTAPTLWAGDQNTDWLRDDGFPTVVPIAVHAGLSGVAIVGSDIAGYTSVGRPNTTKELFYRWTALGTFQGLMRTHHGSDKCGNWAFDRDAETTLHFGRYAKIRTRLYPVFRELAIESIETGLSLNRHPWLVEPGLPSLWRAADYSFFVGDNIYVAPVLDEATTSHTVAMPGDGWLPLLGGAPLATEGATTVSIEVPYTEIPVFVRPGTVLPMLPRVVDSFYGATAEGVTDLGDVAGTTMLALYRATSGAVVPARIGGATIAGEITADAPINALELDNAAVPPCTGDDSTNCYDSATNVLRATGEAIRVTHGDGVLTIDGGGDHVWWITTPESAWGELATVPATPDFDTVVPPPCE